MTDAAKNYTDSHDTDNVTLARIIADFNKDGFDDIDFSTVGQNYMDVSEWSIYLYDTFFKYTYIDTLSFSPEQIAIVPLLNNSSNTSEASGILYIYHNKPDIDEVEISPAIKISSNTISLYEYDLPHNAQYKNVFGSTDYDNAFSVELCSLENNKKECAWSPTN